MVDTYRVDALITSIKNKVRKESFLSATTQLIDLKNAVPPEYKGVVASLISAVAEEQKSHGHGTAVIEAKLEELRAAILQQYQVS